MKTVFDKQRQEETKRTKKAEVKITAATPSEPKRFVLKEVQEGHIAIGDRIKVLRQGRKLSQKQVGEKIGMSQQQIGQYETGVRVPKMETLVKLAAALDCTIFDLVDNWEDFSIEDQKDAILFGGQKAAMVAMYDQLTYDERKKVDAYVSDMLTIHEYNKSRSTDKPET